MEVKRWVEETVSNGVEVSLGEPMSGSNIGWTRRPEEECHRRNGTRVQFWKDTDLFLRLSI